MKEIYIVSVFTNEDTLTIDTVCDNLDKAKELFNEYYDSLKEAYRVSKEMNKEKTPEDAWDQPTITDFDGDGVTLKHVYYFYFRDVSKWREWGFITLKRFYV